MLAIQSPLPVFQKAGLAWEGFFRTNYAGRPWSGTASAGGSGGRTADDATVAPGTGLVQNGFTSARFDGSTNKLACSGIVSDYVGSTGAAWTFSTLLRWNTTVADSGGGASFSSDPAILTDNGGNWGVSLSSAGVRVSQYDNTGGGATPVLRQATNTDVVAASASLISIQARFDGTNISVRVNGGAWANAACTSYWNAILPNLVTFGKANNAAVFLDADVFEWGLAKVAFTDATLDNVRSYYRYRYAISGV